MDFSDLALIEPLQQAVAECGYTTPTAIQARAIPPLLEGRDLLGCAQTGTGKTAAFALPVLQLIDQLPKRKRRPIRALVLSPTRELASQIQACFRDYSAHVDCRTLVITGGVGQTSQVSALRHGVDVLVATPGRLLDLENQGHVDLNSVKCFVLDEADRMLDMGFIHDVKRVLEMLPPGCQNLLFSATLPLSINQLGASFLTDPVTISVSPDAPTVEAIDQTLYYVDRQDKKHLLAELLQAPEVEQAIVFVRTKHGADRLLRQLGRHGIEGGAIHGNKSQGARTRALDGFRDGSLSVLVATDIAARGIDVDGVTHVFQVDLPHEAEVYVHRIGRTGRAGRDGVAILFCDETEAEDLRDVERLTGRPLKVALDHEWHSDVAMEAREAADRRRGRRAGGGGGGGRRGGGGHRRGGGRRGGGGGRGGRRR